MKIKKSAIAAALAAAVAMGVSTHASAYVYAASGLTVNNLLLTNTSGTVVINRFDFTLTNTAALNSVGVISTATCGGTSTGNDCSGTSPVLDAPAVNALGSTIIRPNNATTAGEFTFFGPGATGNYANSDSAIDTAQLVQGVPSSSRNIAEALLTSERSASSSSDIRSVTGFTITFTVDGPTASDLNLTFNADPDVYAAISGELPGTYSAQANLNASFTLEQANGPNFARWTPRGTGADDCVELGGLVCTETADSQNLNVNAGATSNNTASNSSFDPNALNATAFGINITGLTEGTYTLTFNEVKTTSLARTVPEPGVLALMGIGLMGFVASRRKKNSA